MTSATRSTTYHTSPPSRRSLALAHGVVAVALLSLFACGESPGEQGSTPDAGPAPDAEVTPDATPDAAQESPDAQLDEDADEEPPTDADPDDEPPPITARRVETWAPDATAVSVLIDGRAPVALTPGQDGRWEGLIEEMPAGTRYALSIEGPGGTVVRPDPMALALDPQGDRAVAVDLPPPVPFEPVPAREAVIYELHPGSFVDEPGGPPGTLTRAAERLDHLAALGVTTIEHSYGGPEALASFIAQAHARGMAVVVDVVYNHLDASSPLCGFQGEAEGCGPYFMAGEAGQTDWGPRPDFGAGPVRAHLLGSIEALLEGFGADGLRWDSTSNIRATAHGRGQAIDAGRTFMIDANGAIDAQGPNRLSIAEDLHLGAEITRPVDQGGLGFDAQWDAGFHARVREQLMAAARGQRADVAVLRDALLDGWAGGPFQRVIFTENHDTTGALNNHRRLPDDLDPDDPEGARASALAGLGAALLMTAPGIPMLLQGQELLSTGAFHDSNPVDWARAERHAGTLALYRDLIALRRGLVEGTGGLRGEVTEVRHVNTDVSVMVVLRRDPQAPEQDVIVAVNLSEIAFDRYRFGVPSQGRWRVLLNTDDRRYGPQRGGFGAELREVEADAQPYDGYPASVEIAIPARGVVILGR